MNLRNGKLLGTERTSVPIASHRDPRATGTLCSSTDGLQGIAVVSTSHFNGVGSNQTLDAGQLGTTRTTLSSSSKTTTKKCKNTHTYKSSRCKTCPLLNESSNFFSSNTKKRYWSSNHDFSESITCKSTNVIYLLCTIC